jgi:ribose transport system substrate-binding protein
MASAAAGSAMLLPQISHAQAAYEAKCFKPFAGAKMLSFKAKKGPYRIALANGFVGNTWRIQMIKSAKAYAETKGVKEKIKEFKVVSTGTDVAAQVGAIDNFINAGFDAVIFIAVSPTAFGPVIKRAKEAGVVLTTFDGDVNSDEIVQVNEDQLEMGRIMGRWLEKNGATKGKVLEVRGIQGNATDRDRHDGFNEIMKKHKGVQVVEVIGNWDDGTAQKVVADAVAVHGKFAGMYVSGGSTGATRALIDAKHPMIPIAGEAENGFRKLMAKHAKDGLKGASAGQSPGLSAIAIKATIAALEGHSIPNRVSVPIPYVEYTQLKAGDNYYPDLPDNFFTPNEFPPCGVNIRAVEIMKQSESNN